MKIKNVVPDEMPAPEPIQPICNKIIVKGDTYPDWDPVTTD